MSGLSGAFAVNLLAAGIARGTPLLLATVGEVFAERAGVLNLGVEGMMLMGAVTAFATAHATGSALLGVLAGAGAGAVLALVHAFVTVTLRADQVVSGLAIAFVGSGLSSIVGAPLVQVRQSVATIPDLTIPGLSKIPALGPMLFHQNLMVYVGFALVPLSAVWLWRTRPGMHLRAVGENPTAADSLGISVAAYRYIYVIVGGALAGVAGASLSLAITPGWVDGMTAGQGWIAVGLVIFAGWDPVKAAAGAYLFGAIRRLPLDLQGLPSFQDPNVGYFLDMLPYLFTVLVLVLGSTRAGRRKMGAPAALGVPFVRGQR